jgi:hypothetical protein
MPGGGPIPGGGPLWPGRPPNPGGRPYGASIYKNISYTIFVEDKTNGGVTRAV